MTSNKAVGVFVLLLFVITLLLALTASIFLWLSIRSKLAIGLMLLALQFSSIGGLTYGSSQRNGWIIEQERKMRDLLSERKELLELGTQNSDSALIRGLAAYIRFRECRNEKVCRFRVPATGENHQCHHQFQGSAQYGDFARLSPRRE